MKRSILLSVLIVIAVMLALISFFMGSHTSLPAHESTPPLTTPAAYADWVMASDALSGITFLYPKDLGTQFIATVDWPPQVQRMTETYACPPMSSAFQEGGQTEVRRVDGHEYCRTRLEEGAAGSVYTQYAYGTVKEDVHIVITFTLRSVQCGNYDEGESLRCTQEQAHFDPDVLVDHIVQSVNLAS